jgi:hypothetical protein
MTPEGKVKQQVKVLLKKYNCYFFMPVQFGIGASGLDFHCMKKVRHLAIAFFIETKDYDKEPTARQNDLMKHLRSLMAHTFVVDGPATMMELERYLIKLDELDSK